MLSERCIGKKRTTPLAVDSQRRLVFMQRTINILFQRELEKCLKVYFCLLCFTHSKHWHHTKLLLRQSHSWEWNGSTVLWHRLWEGKESSFVACYRQSDHLSGRKNPHVKMAISTPIFCPGEKCQEDLGIIYCSVSHNPLTSLSDSSPAWPALKDFLGSTWTS